ncbi:MAG: RHS repeat-associated core domain-containing protein [Archaeoglobaceae archaeon]
MNFKTGGLGFRRYKEVVGQGVTYFVYDLAESDTPGLAPLIAEYDQNGNLVAKYHHDGGLIAMTRGNQSYWYVFEAIGSVRQLTDTQSQVPDAYFYDAWGNELTSPYSQVPNPFRYVGKHGYYLDTQSALMLLGARFYASANGLFFSRDLIEGYGYTYAADNPVRWIDPRGLQHDSEHCNIVNGQRECAPSRGDRNGKFNPHDPGSGCPPDYIRMQITCYSDKEPPPAYGGHYDSSTCASNQLPPETEIEIYCPKNKTQADKKIPEYFGDDEKHKCTIKDTGESCPKHPQCKKGKKKCYH